VASFSSRGPPLAPRSTSPTSPRRAAFIRAAGQLPGAERH
jgi:hypothetical protein